MWIYGWKPVMVSHHLAMFGGHWSSASGDIKYLTCHVTLQNHVIEGSSNFYKWPSLVAIGIVIVEINVFSLSRDQARLHN